MPNYGVAQAGPNSTPAQNLTVVSPGDTFTLFNAESPAPPQASVVFVRGLGPTLQPAGMVFHIEFAASPTASVEILGSHKAPAANFTLADWNVLYTSTNKQTDLYADLGEFTYYCVYVVSESAGYPLTVIVR